MVKRACMGRLNHRCVVILKLLMATDCEAHRKYQQK